jgi:membrane-bound lytic murein transglycosylase F
MQRHQPASIGHRRPSPALALLLTLLLLVGCGEEPAPIPPSLLAQIKERGSLIVATSNGPTTLYEGAQGQTGFEHDLVALFANRLGVQASFEISDGNGLMLELLRQGKADLAAGLTITPEREQWLRFGPSYQAIEQLLIYRNLPERPPPGSLRDLIGKRIAFAANSALEAHLQGLAKEHPGLIWSSDEQGDNERLINRLEQGELDYIIIPSHHFALVRRYYPHLRVAMSLMQQRPLAWAFAQGADDSLLQEARAFFAEIGDNGRLAQLIERHYGHTEQLNSVDLMVFKRHYQERLPQFIGPIKYAAFASGFDWRLLAAMAYQESHWDPKAVSPTGVRGLMMLTQGTARDIGVTDRNDPQQSILGGARYLRQIRDKLPERIGEPDRTWLALAAYNVGFGHLQDARFLALLDKQNADKWAVVKEYLPRLTEKQWHSQTSYGYARGREPVLYVDNIRSYYDLLQRFVEKEP